MKIDINSRFRGWELRAGDELVELRSSEDDYYGLDFFNAAELKDFITALTAAGNQVWPRFLEPKGHWRDLEIGEDVMLGDRYLQDGEYIEVTESSFGYPGKQLDEFKEAAVTYYQRWVPKE